MTEATGPAAPSPEAPEPQPHTRDPAAATEPPADRPAVFPGYPPPGPGGPYLGYPPPAGHPSAPNADAGTRVVSLILGILRGVLFRRRSSGGRG